ncbi:CRISPR-associated protein Cmr6 [Syntrophus gentianae]|uniref:CRISPR-associated protein Cmr6 n=1 Tax=Syntrophus gentianae TaxID=43775 RepID=A0A1H7ZJH0_9BACT|nr:type III-B CRISPR module RAMP protein Cmr6 [Syntrophus gentianae]SEM58722.1 CRISPR-associated protein Cmr6 [Syntrophus gentianae]
MEFYPLPKKIQDISKDMLKGNFGLWYNKFIPLNDRSFKPSDNRNDENRNVDYYFEQYCRVLKSNSAQIAAMLKYIHENMDDFCSSFPIDMFEEIVICATLETPLVTGIGESHPHEVSIALDHNMGIPYIPASGVKGIVRFAHTVSLIPESIKNGLIQDNLEFDDESNWTFIPLLFGTQGNRGKVIFLDAYPEGIPDLHVDIMNPHYAPYYSEGKPPADHYNPTPIKFLTVATGTNFIFRAVALNEEGLPQKVKMALTRALTEEGVGAKTAVGYGRFLIDEKHQAALMEKRRQRQEEEQNARFPWLAHLEQIRQVADWGQFKQIILDNEKLGLYRHEAHVAEAVMTKALEIREQWIKNWEALRDDKIATWLEPSGIIWQRLEQESEKTEEHSEDYEKISKLTDWGLYKSSNFDLSKLQLDALHFLKQKMEDWGCNSKKAKEDKKTAYKKVRDLLRQH